MIGFVTQSYFVLLSKEHFGPTIVPLKKQSVDQGGPSACHLLPPWRNHRVGAELLVSDVLSSVARRLRNEAEAMI